MAKIELKYNEDEIYKAIQLALNKYPDMSLNGLSLFGKGHSGDITTEDAYIQIAIATAFIKTYGKQTKSFVKTRTSYGLKHSAEKWARELFEGNTYVSNGAFIIAVIGCYGVHAIKPVDHLNCCFRVSFKRV